MGVPIPNYKDEPLKCRKGYFGLRSTSAIVGQPSRSIFAEQPSCHAVFHPVLQFPGSVICNSWDNVTLHFIYGPPNTGGIFFKIKPSQQLLYLGTKEHSSLSLSGDAPLPIPHPPDELLAGLDALPITPGFVEFQDWLPGDTDDDDEAGQEGFRASPAVFLGANPGPGVSAVLDELFPKCLCCDRPMKFVGRLEVDAFSDDLDNITLVLLYCDRCEIQCCLDFE